MVTTGIPASCAFFTVGTSALASQAAITIASTPLVICASMMFFCSTVCVSSVGPWNVMSALFACPAASAPAFTVCQKEWVVPLGITAI
jgi:hypothetical protein